MFRTDGSGGAAGPAPRINCFEEPTRDPDLWSPFSKPRDPDVWPPPPDR